MFIKLLLPAILIIGIALIFLGVRMLIRKNGKFPETEVGHNKEMRKLGINCARVDEIKCRREIARNSGCSTCNFY